MARTNGIMLRSIFVALVLARAGAAWACSCITIPVRDRFLGSQVVFVGTVESVNTQRTERLIYTTADMRVSRWFTGGRGASVAVHVDTSCGSLAVGNEYLVFAHCDTEGGLFHHSGCATRNLTEKYGQEDVKRLRRYLLLWRLERPFWRRWRSLTGQPFRPAKTCGLTRR